MKRALLIAGGTIGGLGVVLSVTPPNFGTSSGLGGGIKTNGSTATPTTSPTTSATTPATTSPTNQATTSATPKATPKTTKKATPTATKPAATKPAATGVSGVFTGAVSQTQFGPVEVQITVKNGKITDAKGLQYPNNDFRSQSISKQAIPFLVQETIAANSSNIQGVGGASYTSQGWYDSLVSALAQAGMK
jgi:uncharacterized protein with FMN-binding domain